MKNALIIVPHQDDELLVAGALIVAMQKSKEWNPYILYTTEGAGIYERVETRLHEAISALRVLKVPENQIIFLGYGNEWSNGKSIYLADPNEELVSLRGTTYTHGLPEHEDYAFQKTGKHHKFTRNNYKLDLKSVINELKPSCIVCVDCDNHPEHMVTSLMFEECMEEILKATPSYQPLVLKKYAYAGLWHGFDDYFCVPRKPTILKDYSDVRNPSLSWDERIAFAVPYECNTLWLRNNILNKAIKKHKSQNGWLCAARLINDDIVYWQKRTDNLALQADISVSSGNAKYLNDFKTVDIIRNVRYEAPMWSNCSWIPEKDDENKKIIIKWKESLPVRVLYLYENPSNDSGQIQDIVIYIGNKKILSTGELKHKGRKNIIDLGKEYITSYIEIEITRCEGIPGISEIEVYSNIEGFKQYEFPMKYYDENARAPYSIRMIRYITSLIERVFFCIKRKIYKMMSKLS